MTTQIAVRLPDEVVAHLDAQVRRGSAKSRSELIRRLLEREQRRAASTNDLPALRAMQSTEDDLDGLAEWSTGQPLPPKFD